MWVSTRRFFWSKYDSRSRKSLPHSPRDTVENFSDEEDGLVVGKKVDEDKADGGDERDEHGSTVSESLPRQRNGQYKLGNGRDLCSTNLRSHSYDVESEELSTES